MKYNCIIVDDEPLARDLILSYVNELALFGEVACFENAIQAYSYLNTHAVDLMFLDIEMPVIKGNDFLKKLTKPPKVIYTTAYREYAIEGYDLNVIDYLLKPITFERFFKGVERFLAQEQPGAIRDGQTEKEFVFVPSGNKSIKVVFNQVLFIESFRDYIRIHFSNQKSLNLKFNISAFETYLTPDFVRVNRSFIINKRRVQSFSKYEVEIEDQVIPVGESYRNVWNQVLEELSAHRITREKGKRRD